MKELPAPHPNKIKTVALSPIEYNGFSVLTVFPFISSNQSKRNFLFLTFTFVSYAVKSSYYIHIFLATHIRDAIEIIISYCLECRNIIEIYLSSFLKTIDSKTVHLIAPLFLLALGAFHTSSGPFSVHISLTPFTPLAPYYQGKA